MRFRHTAPARRKDDRLQMTALIDIVFLLLIFFVMTLKIVSPEGDFNVKMPKTVATGPPVELPPLIVQLRAGEGGRLAAIRFGGRTVSSFDELRHRIRELVDDTAGPGAVPPDLELDLECDKSLRFEHVINALTAVTGYVSADGHSIVKLIRNVRLTNPPGHLRET